MGANVGAAVWGGAAAGAAFHGGGVEETVVGMGRPAAALDVAQIVAEYEDGASLRELEAWHHVSDQRLKRILLQQEVALRACQRRQAEPYYPDDPYKLLALALIATATWDYDHDGYPSTMRRSSGTDAREQALEYFGSVAFLADCEVAELDECEVLLARGEDVLVRMREKWYNDSRRE